MWVRIFGLPLHLWGMSFFKSLGDACGRFVSVDEDTKERRNLQWARIIVVIREWNFPSFLQLISGSTCFAVQLWCESAPWISEVQPSWSCKGSRGKVESRAFLRVAEVCLGKVVGQVLMVDPLPSAKEREDVGEDAAPFLTGSAAGFVWNGHLRGAGALEARLGLELKALASISGVLGSTCG